MSNEVRTVGDLSGKHVGNDTVRIEYGDSVIEGVISALTFTAEYESLLNGTKNYLPAKANISIGDEFELNNFPMHAPATIVTRSEAQ